MKKTVVNLNEIPAWVVGKWYYLAKEGMAGGWYKLSGTKEGRNFPLSLKNHSGISATMEGKHTSYDPARNVLEPWEAAILYPECKDTAPDGVDWSAPELVLPKCLTKDEFEALGYGTKIFWCGNRFVLDGKKNGLGFWSGSDLESGFFLTGSDAQTFQELYEADEIEFTNGTWRMKQSDSASELREVIQNLEAKNAELLADKQSLEYANNILANDCDSYKKENSDLRGVVDSLTAQNNSLEDSKKRIFEKAKALSYELKLSKKVIANLAIRLQAHEDI